MVSKSRTSAAHSTEPTIGQVRASDFNGLRFALAAAIAVLAVAYLVWFLSFPVVPGMSEADGTEISRLLFLTRVMLPELWWDEMTGGGRLPLGIGDRLPVGLFVLVWLVLAWVVGSPLIRLGFGRYPSLGSHEGSMSVRITRMESVALATLAGLALLSTATLVVGLLGGSASRLGIGSLVLAMAGGSLLATNRLAHASSKNPNPEPSAQQRWLPAGVVPSGVFAQLAGRLVVVLTLLLALVYGLGVMMPPFEFDVVEYHLQSAKEFYQLGFIGFNDHNIYVNMPLGLEMHSLAAMSLIGGADVDAPDGWWMGGLVGKAVIGSHSLIAAMLIGGFVARKTDSRWIGWGAAGLWLSVPGNAHVATSGLIDAALSTYILASLVVLTELWQRLLNQEAYEVGRLKWLVLLAFIYSGAAAAAKYPGLIYAVGPCIAAVAWRCVMFLRQAASWWQNRGL